MTTIDMNESEKAWSQKYRPKFVKDAILPESIKQIFLKFIEDDNIPNLILAGSHGMGKTTAAIAMLEEIGADYIKINGSLENGIDTLRYKISQFASSVSFTGKRKVVVIDEADYLSPAIQAGLRSFIEEYSKNCGFIFTCNLKNRIIEPLRESRFTTIDYIISNDERPKLAMQFFKRVLLILEQEGVSYDKKAVAAIVDKFFPDFRKTLNQLQKIALLGPIDEGSFVHVGTKNESVPGIFKMLKEKKFTELRTWIGQNQDGDFEELYTELYNLAPDYVELKSMPGFVILVAKYQYQHNFVADPGINMMGLFAELLLECSFK